MKHAHVTLTDSGTGRIVWTGSLKEFFVSNQPSAAERAIMCHGLRRLGLVLIGGGAAPLFELRRAGAHIATLAVAAVLLAGCTRAEPEPVRPAAPTGLVTIKDGAPAWCLDPDYPRGDMWYENCAEPVR